jgi:hypothetical protein
MNIQQTIGAVLNNKDDVPATTTVTAIRSTKRFELLSMDRGAAVSAVTGARAQDGTVDKCGHEPSQAGAS